ncbi:MAG: cyclodeaminase/cyclohydrolase family protein [Bacillota bacterium]|nr:cyclodeaminase/cyclohydrolase family protein [Bacillota bacterium]
MLKDLTVTEFMETLASDSPVPGGGSVAALCAATACDLVAMVASLTIGKKGYEEAWEEMTVLKEEMVEAGEKLLDSMDEDADSYARVVGCFKLPKETEEEKAARAAAIQEATREAALVPLGVAEAAAELFGPAAAVIARGNKNAASDGAVAAMMARTAVLSALYNVRINAVSLKDAALREELLEKADRLEKRAREQEGAILEQLRF